MSVSRDDVTRIAALARLAIPPERVDALVGELNGILGHMEALQQVAAPPAEADATNAMPLAADSPPPVALERPREAFAPLMRDGFFLVPRLASHEGAGSES